MKVYAFVHFHLFLQVIWPNGVKSNYRFGYKNKYDLLLCDPRDPEIMQLYQFQKEMFSDEKSTSSENKQ